MSTFNQGDRVRKKSGSEWQGRIVGWYSTELTPEGYAVTQDGFKPQGAMMQIEEPEAKPSLQALNALILDGDLIKAVRLLCDLYGFKLDQFFGEEVEDVT